MKGRTYSTQSSYRYGFNGKENDNEVKGEGDQQDYGMRIFDPRLGRFLSVDPLIGKYPFLTPYQFASNRPIDGVDLDGLEFFKSNNGKYSKSLYGLNKFFADDKDYTMGNINIRNNELHKIIENHPRLSAQNENPKDDDSTPEVRVVQKRRQDNKASRAKTEREVKAANNAMAPDIVGGIIDLIQWGKETAYDIKHGSELSYGAESLKALARSDDLVRAASKSSSFPAKLNQTKQLTDLVNYMLDFTLPQDGDQKYTALIQTWGNLLMNHEDQILKGTYNFSVVKTIYTTVTKTTNQSDNVQYKFIIEQKAGNDDMLLKLATDQLNNTTLPPSQVLKQRNN